MTGSTPDFVPIPASGVETCDLDGERLVWRGGVLYRLDAVGSVVWTCFDGQANVRELSRTLADAFGASEHEVQQDVSALCTDLIDQGLLEGGRPPALGAPPPMRMDRLPSAPLDGSRTLPCIVGPFRALDYDFGIRTDDRRLAAYCERTLGSFKVSEPPTRWYSVVESDEPAERYRIYLDAEGLFAASRADAVVRYLLWHVNYAVITESTRHLLVHAAGATIGQAAVVLPGEMNAGKTTLVAALGLDGFGILTDELVALNLGTGLIDPYPRPLNIEPGSWELLAGLRPPDRDDNDPLPQQLWHVDPGSVRPGAVSPPAPIRWVLTPRFERGVDTRVEPMSRSEAVVLLYRHAFNKHRFGDAGIRALVDAVKNARCGRLVNGDLSGAVAAVRRFVAADGLP